MNVDKGDTCVVNLVMDGLEVKTSCFKQKAPLNFKVIKQEIGVQSIDLIVDVNEKNANRTSRYRFFVDTLPQEIIPSKTKIDVTIDIFWF